jgi:ferredoxin
MAHAVTFSAYQHLTERINRFPQGAPPSDLLYTILKMLFTEKEAGRVALLPIKPFTSKMAARIWKVAESEARRQLDVLSSRGLLLDMEESDGRRRYVLPPPMAGFFEFSMMRVRGDIDQKVLADLFYQYLNVEDEFIRELFTHGETQLGRIFAHEQALEKASELTVLDYDHASEVIRSASHRGIGICYCRHKMKHMNRACEAPLDICMTFNTVAASLTRHGIARSVDAVECLDLLEMAQEHYLVQFGENVRKGISFMCNCCGCCCEAMLAAKRFAFLHPVHTSNYAPSVRDCTGCGRCKDLCPVDAIELSISVEYYSTNRKRAVIDQERCLGCGVCATGCPRGGIIMVDRPARLITPVNSAHRAVSMAIERGKLQNLIFDNQAFTSHRAMAAVLGAILKLPPLQRVLASRQMKSRYLDYVMSRVMS